MYIILFSSSKPLTIAVVLPPQSSPIRTFLQDTMYTALVFYLLDLQGLGMNDYMSSNSEQVHVRFDILLFMTLIGYYSDEISSRLWPPSTVSPSKQTK